MLAEISKIQWISLRKIIEFSRSSGVLTKNTIEFREIRNKV